ncbi:YggS family pyridoxal phosphate-dependent enzyme [Cellvibrio japonicus]|nr:YggS family pyridoxal phosphate-dependent enzyme [Cellvibrio japonicus]QEI14011.1 YggS family pyridoxal phosphate-dependent enzyme [Cellvibrio japonicus]QEI17585.1 YggS family pyridoxal phosphate-dependent enzyme [Cellvibrio japonicus]QEI21160.1 YggS family pyridoxal phosphate-dependent enzyme [Cellvibrio japonicus]
MHKIDDKLAKVTERIHQAAILAGRDPQTVQLIAVSKTQPPAAIAEAYAWGQRRFGENYLQEALDKQQALHALDDLQWHFIGPIQSNKTRLIAAHFAWVHSVDRLRIAQRLNDQRPEGLPPLEICIQVNIDDEDTKSGVNLAELPALALAIQPLKRLRLRGLMAIPVATSDTQQQRASFSRLRLAVAALNRQGLALDTLSMGMSGDLEAAIAEGATFVRVGTDIFGARQ